MRGGYGIYHEDNTKGPHGKLIPFGKPEVTTKRVHMSVPSCVSQLVSQGSCTKKALGHHSWIYRGPSQEAMFARAN